MIKAIKTDKQTLDLLFIEDADCWQTQCKIDGCSITIEIDSFFHKQKEIDWEHFKEFFNFINKKGLLQELILDSHGLVTELGIRFFKGGNEHKNWTMKFNGSIFYNGRTDGTFIRNGYSYSLIFNFLEKKSNGIDGDAYGLYLVDIEDQSIVGTRRHQI